VIDCERRFDFMQHHSGQHILSRAFEDLMDAQTIGFHMSDNSVTIDLDKPNISVEQIAAAERLSNQIILENRPVRAWFPDEGELGDLALRKISEKVTGAVRVVDMGGFDACACGGTHIANTGEIGILKIVRTEDGKKHTRVEFVCGWRALADYHRKNGLLLQIAHDMTMSYDDVPEAVLRLQNENKSLTKALKGARGRLLQYEAEELWAEARAADPEAERVVLAIIWEDREPADLNSLMPHLIKKPKTVALMGIPGEKAHLIFGCSEDLGYDVVPLLRAALDTLGTQSGGGRPTLAQGGGFKASRAQMDSVMDYARERAKRGE
jgi:alanyl-tRNA synthetase